ncbi:MAG TPA: DUF3300 domain-containing protein [Gemmatimonadaceae bacterium]|nr:DUF3300 domain-containing protein [Gemmatimonadaceae bacterium]
MRTTKSVFFVALLVPLAMAAVSPTLRAQDDRYPDRYAAPVFTTEQLDNLVAPIALYPDPILAQVLIAATFPDQLDIAARYVRANGTRGIDEQNWDVSVKAVAHYPPVLNMLADRDDWTTALGQAYASQSSEVMESVQHLRAMAHAQGNLESTREQNVLYDDGYYQIVPAQPRVIYVPTYDPYLVYYRPLFHVGFYASSWSFGIGFPIGAWLSYDCDWRYRRVYYDGWRGGGWRVYSYPYIAVNTVYIHPRYETVYVNRDVWRRPIDYGRFNRYNTVHRTVDWNTRGVAHSPGPIPRVSGGSNRDDRYGAPSRDDGRNRSVNPRDGYQGRTDGRNDGRNDGQNRNPRFEDRGQSRSVPESRGPAPRAPEARVPETRVPETRVPPTRAPETRIPQSRGPETGGAPRVIPRAEPRASGGSDSRQSRVISPRAVERSAPPPREQRGASSDHRSGGSSQGQSRGRSDDRGHGKRN